MTEAEWNSCTDSQAMLDGLRQQGKVSDRKARLFSAACCRRIWPLLRDERSRRAVEAAERYADGLATLEELRGAEGAAGDAAVRENHPARAAACCTIVEDDDAYDFVGVPAYAAGTVSAFAVDAATYPFDTYDEAITARSAERTAQAALLRDLFGNPFQPSPSLDPALLRADIVALARSIYDERAMPGGTLDRARLTVLADALEEAGCADADLLGHLRGPGPCVRGCWVVDLILQK